MFPLLLYYNQPGYVSNIHIRFDKLLYLGVSDTHEAQLRIIQALTRK